jgi:uncharacterized protein (TIGR02646 family)
MGRLVLSDPPQLKGAVRYKKYRNWLLANFHYRICGYCFCVHEYVVIDHISPQDAFASLTHRHDNLIMACQTCNRQKGDYHPGHHKRKRMGKVTAKHLVLNCKNDDFATLLNVNADGEMTSRVGPDSDKADWTIALLALDRDFLVKYRAKAIRNLNNLDAALKVANPPEPLKQAIADLIDSISKTQLFYRVMGIQMSTLVEIELSKALDRPLAKAV